MPTNKRRQLTRRDREFVFSKCAGHCAYCGLPITIDQMQVDHVEPFSRGGADILDNMLPSCQSCNRYKKTMTLEDFRGAASRWADILMRDNPAYRSAVRFGLVVQTFAPVIFYFEKLRRENGK